MRIEASNVQLSSAHLFEARRSITERLQIRVGPGRGEECHGHHGPGGRCSDNGAERTATEQDAPARFDLRLTRRESYQEVEATSFRASGSVATADGRQIDFSQALDLARAYARTETISLRLTGTLDPKAASPAGAPAADAPATAASPAAAPVPAAPATQQALSLGGSVLAYDANGDGKIDPKTELLGQSGDGFAELAKYDDDKNGFIDEGDQIFSKLALVDRTAGGLTATTLTAKGVGAIYTGSVATPYTLTDTANQPLAQIARSGVFINENGSTGIAQQVNVLV